MFRLQDNVPSVYIDQSRDFQLFCRVYDCINNAVKYDIDTIINILDPMTANDRILELLCTYVGFFPKMHYDSYLLRYIIASFSHAIKYKGTKHGINIAVSTILKAERNIDAYKDIDVVINIDKLDNSIWIYTTVPINNKYALKDFLSYIIPIGYSYQFGIIDPREVPELEINSEDSLVAMVNPSVSNSQVRGVDRYLDINSSNKYQFKSNIENTTVGSYLATQVIGADNPVLTGGSYGNDIAGSSRDVIDQHTDDTVHLYEEEN